ncbi:MAG: hypothetical protein Q8920_08625 [Bacillota bacterium]|nr:hypothetical protein [Bacillota bacterium]
MFGKCNRRMLEGWLERHMNLRLKKLYDQYIENGNYSSLLSKEEELYNRLEAGIPGTLLKDLECYCTVMSDIVCGNQEYFYRGGFADCMELIKVKV